MIIESIDELLPTIISLLAHIAQKNCTKKVSDKIGSLSSEYCKTYN